MKTWGKVNSTLLVPESLDLAADRLSQMFEVGFGKSAKEDIIGAPLPPSDRGRGETANELGGRFVWRSCFSGTKRDVAAIRLGVIGAQHLPGTVPNGTDPGELQTALRKSGHDRSRGA